MTSTTHHPTRPRNRWAFLIWLAMLSLLLASCGGTTQAKTYTIGVVNETEALNPVLDGFKAGMVRLGYIEGQNITYIYHGVLGTDPQKTETEIKRLVDQKVDLLLTLGNTPTVAVKKIVAGTDMPVVFAPIVNPVEEGVVASLSHPGGNLTGVQSVNTTPKVLEWLLKLAPGTKTVYAPYSPADRVAVTSIKSLPDAATKLGVALMLDDVSTGDEELAAIKALPKDSAILFITSPSLNAVLPAAKQLAIELGIPTGSRNLDATDLLFIYSTDQMLQGQQAATLADKIVKGLKPADLPIESPEFILRINLKVAKAISLDVPDAILQQAAEVIR